MKIQLTRDHTLGKKGTIVDVAFQTGTSLIRHQLGISVAESPRPVIRNAAPGVEVLGPPPAVDEAPRRPLPPMDPNQRSSKTKTPSAGKASNIWKEE